MDQARQTPGKEVRGVIAGRLGVGVLVEVVVIAGEDESLDEIWVGFGLPPLAGATELPPQPEWIMTVLAAMVPVDVSAEAFDFSGSFPRAADPNRTRSSSAGGRFEARVRPRGSPERRACVSPTCHQQRGPDD